MLPFGSTATVNGESKRALARAPSIELRTCARPARVNTSPSGLITRIVLLNVSAMTMFPLASTSRPHGLLNPAEVPVPSAKPGRSPINVVNVTGCPIRWGAMSATARVATVEIRLSPTGQVSIWSPIRLDDRSAQPGRPTGYACKQAIIAGPRTFGSYAASHGRVRRNGAVGFRGRSL